MFNDFPVIHTNIWDAVWAVPVILVMILLLKILFRLRETWFSTAATVVGLIISIFISHQGNLAAGIFMGFVYGGVASGTIYSLKVSFIAYRRK